MSGKINSLNKKLFSAIKNFKLFIQIREKSVTSCHFLKFVISVWGSHCGYSPRARKSLATPLITNRRFDRYQFCILTGDVSGRC